MAGIKPLVRATYSACAVLLVATGVAGCDVLMEDSPSAQLSVKLEKGVLSVANCGTPVSGKVQVFMGENSGGEFNDFFIGILDDGWDTGEVLSPASDRWAQIEKSETPVLEPGAQLSIPYIADGGGRVADFIIPGRGVPENAWLHPDGTTTSEMCVE